MERNVGSIDKIIRIIAGIAFFAGAYFASGWLAWFLLILGVASLATAAFGFCGLYTLLGWNTCPLDAAQKSATPKKP